MFLGTSVAWADTHAFEPLNPEAAGAQGRRTPIVEAIEKARPAVVSVYAQVQSQRGNPFRRDPFSDDFFNRFYNDMWQPRARQNIVLGSGVIINGTRGLVVTNEHVVRGATSIKVTLSDGREMTAKVLGADPRFDLAVLELDTKQSLPELKLGDSNDLMIGETVIAIGNPFGLSHTATTGVVSATGRSLPGTGQGQGLKDLIQTDASINPGNSGGPLLNIKAEVVGINTAIVARGEGLGFAIPASQVQRITARLAQGDKGALALDLGLKLAESGQPRKGETGCLVLDVEKGSPAESAGIRKGDMLMKLDGSPTVTLDDYEIILASLKPGRPVEAEVLRNKKLMTLTPVPRELTKAQALDLAWDLYGLKAKKERQVMILNRPKPGSPAERLGLKEGDALLSLGSKKITDLTGLAQTILAHRFQNSIEITVQRGRSVYRTSLNR